MTASKDLPPGCSADGRLLLLWSSVPIFCALPFDKTHEMALCVFLLPFTAAHFQTPLVLSHPNYEMRRHCHICPRTMAELCWTNFTKSVWSISSLNVWLIERRKGILWQKFDPVVRCGLVLRFLIRLIVNTENGLSITCGLSYRSLEWAARVGRSDTMLRRLSSQNGDGPIFHRYEMSVSFVQLSASIAHIRRWPAQDYTRIFQLRF